MELNVIFIVKRLIGFAFLIWISFENLNEMVHQYLSSIIDKIFLQFKIVVKLKKYVNLFILRKALCSRNIYIIIYILIIILIYVKFILNLTKSYSARYLATDF